MWGGEFEHEVLTTKPLQTEESLLRLYRLQDAAFFHKPTKTLLLCDTLVSVSSEPPPILTSQPEYLRHLLFHARDHPLDIVVDSPEVRSKGWQRIVLLAFFFFPGSATFSLLRGDLRNLDYGWAGILPFDWRQKWEKSFEAVSANGKPLQHPLVQVGEYLESGATRQWVDKVTRWKFEHIVPAHFDAPLALGPKQFAETFDFLDGGRNKVRYCDEDIRFIRETFGDLLPEIITGEDMTDFARLSGPSCSFD
eukprot:gnl/TRDRNA2_/TRDRNA2_147439_c3_seq1.p1 gnl/TRDRNA2_/TRDRNA2_147439_c3~~gnl/TRDRNA2_/TRDRNA2_147439_c3_seq1.p1  ORF type:complete len:265 (-),score=32.04 gnl/TRDRNA2_/TRDRNA2_147439_c3_seq1:331-1083(-)